MGLIALALFIIAGILELVGKHLNWVIWLVIFGGILLSLGGVWGTAGGWTPWRRP